MDKQQYIISVDRRNTKGLLKAPWQHFLKRIEGITVLDDSDENSVLIEGTPEAIEDVEIMLTNSFIVEPNSTYRLCKKI